MQTGQNAFAAKLASLREIPGPKGPQETVESVIRAGRSEGLQAIILQPRPEQLVTMTGQLPAVVEQRDGRYAILAEVGGGKQGEEAVTVLTPLPDGRMQSDRLPLQAFFAGWAGGLLRFKMVNTALVCFSIVAREHKIELTRDRLLHEYNLGTDEIPKNTLLRMAKELGLKARLLNLNWKSLVNLQKAYPAIAGLRNGRHVVLTGVTERAEKDQPRKLSSPVMTPWPAAAAAISA